MASSSSHIMTKAKKHSGIVWTGAKMLIRLADSAQLPVVGGALSAAVEIIDWLDEASVNQRQCRDIITRLAEYGNMIWELVSAMGADYLRESTDRQAGIARTAIKAFGGTMDRLYAIIQLRIHANLFMRAWYRRRFKEDIQACEEDLDTALRRFRSAQSSITVAAAHDSGEATADIHRMLEEQIPKIHDEFRITGAKPMPATAITMVNHLTAESDVSEDQDDFWRSIWQVEVEGKMRLAKLYISLVGGQAAFREELERLGRNWNKNYPRVIGHCVNATPPFIVFEESSFTPTKKTHKLPKLTAVGPIAEQKPKPILAEPGSEEMVHAMAGILNFFSNHLKRVNEPV